jgi:hypothetical protein
MLFSYCKEEHGEQESIVVFMYSQADGSSTTKESWWPARIGLERRTYT